MGVFSSYRDRPRAFSNILVHPTQELPHPTLYRGGPDWPAFERQILARHCWGAIPKPIDRRPHPVEAEWPYFDRERYMNPRYGARQRWRALLPDSRPQGLDLPLDAADAGLWCGPVNEHFGVAIAEYGMRLAASSRHDPETPLVFSMYPLPDREPEPFFWAILDHFGIDRRRVMLIRKPTRFARLLVYPQAERPNGGRPSRRHLDLMDAIAAGLPRTEPDHPPVFVSRSRLERGNFAGESYLDEAMAAAGVSVFHPQTVDLPTQLRLYRRAPRLIFSEGSALHALQLLGHIEAELVILTRRPGNRLAAASLRPRTRRVRYLTALRGIVHGLNRLGDPSPVKGISVIDEARLIDGLRAFGVDLAPHWEPRAYAERRDADVAAWVAGRFAAPVHPEEREIIVRHLAALSMRHLAA